MSGMAATACGQAGQAGGEHYYGNSAADDLTAEMGAGPKLPWYEKKNTTRLLSSWLKGLRLKNITRNETNPAKSSMMPLSSCVWKSSSRKESYTK